MYIYIKYIYIYSDMRFFRADLSSLPKTSMINLPPYRERDVNSHKNLSTMMFNIETIRVMEVFLKSK